MIKLVKYLKPFALWIVVAIALLYGQAMTDLALPDYMSNIVNVGIQQGGNDDVLPQVMRQADYDRLTMFLTTEDRTAVINAYHAVEPGTSDYDSLADEYPNNQGERLLALKALTDEETALLEPVVAKALLAVSGIQRMMEEAGADGVVINGQTIPVGTDIFLLLKNMPVEQRIQLMDEGNEQFSALGDDMIIQAGASATLSLYEDMGKDVDSVRQHYILKTGLIMLGIALLGAIASIAVGFIAAKVAAGLGRDLRSRIFDKVSRFSNVEFDKFSTASLITRSTNDIMQVQNLLVVMIRMVFYAPILGIGGVIRAMDSNSSMSWIIALAVGILILMIAIVFVIAMPKFKIVQKQVDKVNLVMREALTGMMVIRAFNTQAFEEDRFDQANRDLTATNLFVNRVMVFLMPVMMFVMNAVMILIVWVGAKEIADANMQVGDMMAFMQYAMQIIMAFLMMSMMFIMIPRASVAAGRIAEVLDAESLIKDPVAPQIFAEPVAGRIEFKDVSFRYPGAEEDMLKQLSFTANPGETTAIIGSTGSGKTTLVNLIPRLYDVTKGEILLDGIDIRQVTQHDLRAQIGYVPQKASLFSGNIKSNLRFAKEDATEAEMEEAIRIAQATEFVDAKAEGMDAQISQGGGNVSGGQKQRLSIARALVKKPPVYVFDDSFSALDFRTDQALRQALREKTGNATLLIVAQRISTIKNADQILVLEDGRMAGIGKHEELMRTCDTYREIAYSQLSKEELA